jgi:hypothetical protein
MQYICKRIWLLLYLLLLWMLCAACPGVCCCAALAGQCMQLLTDEC